MDEKEAPQRPSAASCTHAASLWQLQGERQLRRSLLAHFQERKVLSRRLCSASGCLPTLLAGARC